MLTTLCSKKNILANPRYVHHLLPGGGSCRAELTTHINSDLAVMTVLWLLSPTPETSLRDSCSQRCISYKLISRAPSVSCATRLKLSILFFFYPGISSEPLNLSQQKFARWWQVVRNRTWRVSFFEFLRGVRLGAKTVTFCPDLPGVTFTKYNMAPKRRTDIKNRKLSCSGQIISLPNGENRAKIRKGTAEILWCIYMKFRFLPAIFPVSSSLKLYNFYTVQHRGIQSAYEMLRMKRAF